MHFALFANASSETCAVACRPLIAASGMITADTARQFIAFVRDNALQAAKNGQPAGQPGATVVLESDGGSVLGALDFGRAIRRFGFATTVGRVVERRATPFMKYGEATPRGDCQSMCTFVLLAGVQRTVPAGARVLVHQIWLGDRREDAVASNYTAEDLVVVQRDVGSILQYTIEMGGDPELVELSLKVPPWEPMRALTREEIRRTKLDDMEVALPAAPAEVKTAAGPTLSDDESQPSPPNGRGWIMTQRGGQPVLTRNHPLTLEGERIGSFSLLVSCGTTPDTFTLTYRELRMGPADRGLPRSISQVALVLDEHLQPFKITSSERKGHGGELESVATTVMPARLVRTLSSDGPASMTLETDSVGNPRTMIRIGNVGFGRGFHEMERTCKEARPSVAAVR
ncbi:MAG: hypothetical protein J2P53_10815 [Bradyrhizobiaceae bacterium]|nr:hypothetical protein [Bradyrhizobiaceae bacterium]